MLLAEKCTRGRRAIGALILAASIAYSGLLFHPTIGYYLVRAGLAAYTITLGLLFYRYFNLPCRKPPSSEEYREKIIKAKIE